MYTAKPYTAADYIRDLEADAARWEEYAAQARGPYKQDHIADGRYLAGLFRAIAATERQRLGHPAPPRRVRRRKTATQPALFTET